MTRSVPFGQQHPRRKNVGIAVIDSAIFDGHHVFVDSTGNKRITERKEFVTGGRKINSDTERTSRRSRRDAAENQQIAFQQFLRNYQGIAPKRDIIAVRVLDNIGRGSTAKLIEAINWIYGKRVEHNIRVVNMSLGTAAIESWRNDPLCRAVRN